MSSATQVSAEICLPKRRELPSRPAGRERLVRDPDTGRVHFLNAPAALIWDCCDGKTAQHTCVQRLRTTFAIDSDVNVDEDVQAALADLATRGLLEEAHESV